MSDSPDWEDLPTCPHCGGIDQDWWELKTLRDDGDESETECPFCSEPIKIVMCVSCSFLTTKRLPEQADG